MNCPLSSVASKPTFIDAPLLFSAWIAVGIESCLKPAVAEYIKTRAGPIDCAREHPERVRKLRKTRKRVRDIIVEGGVIGGVILKHRDLQSSY